MIRRLLSLLVLLPLAGARPVTPPAPDNLARIKLPAGFRISYFAQNVGGARSLALGADGTVYVGTRGQKVYALPDRNRDGRADEVLTIAAGLNEPNGVAVRNGALYVAEISRILRFDNIGARLKSPPRPVVVYDQLPDKEHHGWKYISFGPDGKLYVPVGAPCNVCLQEEPIFATITRMNPDGTGLEIFARGVRNTVGFDWSPVDQALWFTDNGRDLMGDDVPACELNRAPNAGLHFALRLSLHPPGRPARPAVRQGQVGRDLRSPGPQAGRARGAAGHEVLHRPHVPGCLPQPDSDSRARLLEPLPQERLPHNAGEARRQRPAGHVLRTLRHGLAAGRA
ncbi:PQQ-dependent sugar dehydrogenase [Hymenobacter sp. B81]|uniref:PQQ-dependent sugar dehydrogenase n=1 Tax=Hymenobacter sp. B81 TaxID=3344878 RepID=UPI0037DD235B